jgi:hypothetical protein
MLGLEVALCNLVEVLGALGIVGGLIGLVRVAARY